MSNIVTAFISYAWENEALKKWVKDLATKLRQNGIDAKLDQWEVVPGDQMPHFMEKSVRENDYVLIVCTEKYKNKSENRIGGVGYEGDIMTAEVLKSSNHRKFIPILKSGNKDSSLPSWLQGKYFIDLSNEMHFEKNFEDLITTLLNVREAAPSLGATPSKFHTTTEVINKFNEDPITNDIKIKGILVNEVSSPSNDGTRSSALYRIPFELNRRPGYEWVELFINAWNWPPEFTTMHRPGIASVNGNKIILDGTDIEEVERYHKKTLKLAVEVANNNLKQIKLKQAQREEQERKRQQDHRNKIDDVSRRINFDDW